MGRGDVADVGGIVIVNELTWDEGRGVLTMITLPKTMNDDIIVVHHLVATLPTATWHLSSRSM